MSKITFKLSNDSNINTHVLISSINNSTLLIEDVLKPNEEYILNKKYIACLSKKSDDFKDIAVGFAVKMNQSFTVPLQSLSWKINGETASILFPPDIFLPYVLPNNLEKLPEEYSDLGLNTGQNWKNCTPNYFFNTSNEEILLELVVSPSNQDQIDFKFFNNSTINGLSVTLPINMVDDVSLEGTSYTATGDFDQMAPSGVRTWLTAEINENGNITTHTTSHLTGSSLYSYNIHSCLSKMGLELLEKIDETSNDSWYYNYSLFNFNRNKVVGNSIATLYSKDQKGIVINSLYRRTVDITFLPTENLPENDVDLYDLLKNQSGESKVTSRGYLSTGISKDPY